MGLSCRLITSSLAIFFGVFFSIATYAQTSASVESKLFGAQGFSNLSAPSPRSSNFPKLRPRTTESRPLPEVRAIFESIQNNSRRKALKIPFAYRQINSLENDFGSLERITSVGRVSLLKGGSSLSSLDAISGLAEEALDLEIKLESNVFDSVLGEVRKYQIYEKGLPVWGNQVIEQESNGQKALLGSLYQSKSLADGVGVISDNLARTISLNKVERSQFELIDYSVESVIHTIGSRKKTYTKVELQFKDDHQIIFIDPATKRVVHSYSNIKSVAAAGSGTDLNGKFWTFPVWEENGFYYLFDQSLPTGGYSIVYDSGNQDTFENAQVIFSTAPDGPWDPAGVSAYVGHALSYFYFLNTFGRNSVDGVGAPLTSYVHVGQNYANATWNNLVMRYGDGDNISLGNFAACLDVVAHEISHGVVEHTANLIYQNQSGALNESFADVFGVMVDREDWLLGEDCVLGEPGFLRSLQNPNLGRQPAHFRDYVYSPISQDAGGVHSNSGIPNRAAYLIAEGLTQEGLGQSIGKASMEQIFYNALLLLSANADFLDARIATITAAEARFGEESVEAIAVETAWNLVGITENMLPTSSGGTEKISNVTGTDAIVYLYPTDGTHDKPYDSTEDYEVYVQVLSNPFSGYDSQLDFGPLNTLGSPRYTRPAAYSENGDPQIIYVGIDNNIYFIDSDGEEQLTTEGGYISVAISPNGQLGVFAFEDSNTFAILNIVTGAISYHEVNGPDYSDRETLGTVVTRLDSLAFNYSSQKLIFDFASCVPTFEANCDDASAPEYWSIGVLDVPTNRLTYPFPAQPSDIDVGYPRFASTTDRYWVFDLIDYSEFDATGEAKSNVVIYDTRERDFEIVIDPNLSSNKVFGYGLPSFSGDDDYVLFQALFDDSGVAVRVDLDNYSVVPGTVQTVNDFDVALPYLQRTTTLEVASELVVANSLVDLGGIAVGTKAEGVVSITNIGNRELQITGISKTSDIVSHNLTNLSVLPNQTINFAVYLLMNQGDKSEQLSIQHTGDNPAVTIDIVAKSLLDFDLDGSPDETDSDDDNDGTPDTEDAFPLNADEAVDTDGDGIGNNADTDDDGDDIPDAIDPFPLDKTLEACTGTSSGSVRLGAGQFIELPVRSTCLTAPSGASLEVPVSATAASLNVTAVTPGAPGFVTVWPCGVARPNASSLNFVAGDVVPNGVIAPLGSNGSVCLYSSAETDMIVDVAGWFEGDSFVGATPQRLVDTRDGTGGQFGQLVSTSPLVVKATNISASTAAGVATTIPSTAGTVALNITVVAPDAAGFITVYPCDAPRPLASNVNYVPGQVVANGVIAPVSASGEVCVYSQAATDVIVDLAGWFPGDAFTGATPQRLVDTRDGTGAPLAKLNPASQLNVAVQGAALTVNGSSSQVPSNATAAAMNVTVVNPEAAGFVTVWPCSAARPNASNLNFTVGKVVANNVVAPIGDQGSVCFYSSVPTDVIVDISGYFTGESGNQFVGAAPKRFVDTRSSLGPVVQ